MVLFAREEKEDCARTVYLNETLHNEPFPPNLVRNQKYSLWNFAPLVLYEQFKFFFNLYFLLVALSQFIPALRIGYLFTYFAPLAFVLAVTIGKEAADDYKRSKRDKEANSQLYSKIGIGGSHLIPSSDIKVGDLISVSKDQRVPADGILLQTTESSGSCFIRTDQLDGETDWKLKVAIPYTQRLPSENSLLDLRGFVYAEAPQKDIHSFVGNFNVTSQSGDYTEALNVENVVWMNTVIASGAVIFLVIYTGVQTRAVMNTSFPKTKVGLLDLQINRLSKVLALVTLVLSIAMVALNEFRGNWLTYLFRFLILFSSIIPISLRVNLDMGKTVYSTQIMRDPSIPETVVRTSTIPEELGRIGYLLTDKTGTLTQNEMELKRLHLGTLSYSGESMDDLRNLLEAAVNQRAVSANDHSFRHKKTRDIGSRILDTVLALVLCHNVTPVVANDDSICFQASSPDEIAIVKWAELVGLTLYFRDRNSIRIQARNGDIMDFDILEIFPFTSETKRMGIVVREVSNGEITFYEKGADSIMAKLVVANDWLEEECGNMAREGLRTLVFGRKRLSEELFSAFQSSYSRAKINIHERNESMTRIVKEFLECDLELLGISGVEDKLQASSEDVKYTLELLRNAGLRVWMLTGDKIETATCIAVSSKLVSRNQAIHEIAQLNDPAKAADELNHLQMHPDSCLILDGESLQLFIQRYCEEFLEIATRLPTVVCCRCSPTQKAEVTRLIKSYTGLRTCAIGDGGNDVSMIQAAHVGIGIVGKEGKQASLAADFSIPQFSHLTRLLLWHGRNSYKRSAKLSQFVIHRGLIISIMQAVFSAIFYFAPIALYQDVDEDTAILYPELYKELRKGRALSFKTFFVWLSVSVYQGGAIMLLATWLFEDEFVNIVSISFTALVFNELLMVALEINRWHIYMIYSEIITFTLYIASMWFLKSDFGKLYYLYFLTDRELTPSCVDMTFILTSKFVWKTAVITTVSSLPLYILKFAKWKWSPPNYTKLAG
ncbi:hypothetical protein DFS34DRAFT_643233 [Phlyctochytrium arcticum]|nr:hypothetical protein DFS34DRAFT_643233 [Phlyctochytrium arcticum]